jgi:hypothetical protein
MTLARVELPGGAWGELVIGGGIYVVVALVLGRLVGEAAVCNVVLSRFAKKAGSEPSS